jgi:hypothetical protein
MCHNYKKHFSPGIIFVILLSMSNIYSQVDTLWTKTFGGDSYDLGYSVQQTLDEGYIITGYTSSFGAGNYDIWLIKTDAGGDTTWTKTFGGIFTDMGQAVQQTNDEGYIITGYTSSSGAGSFDALLIKTDSAGDTLWTKRLGSSGDDYAYSVQQTVDQGYIVTGITSSFGANNYDLWLVKIDASGDTLWTKMFGGSGIEAGYSVQQTADEGFIICGSTDSFGNGPQDLWLIKTDAAGDTVWTKTLGGDAFESGNTVRQTADNGYIICGCTDSFGAGDFDAWLIKTDANGDTLWTQTFGGSYADLGNSVRQTTDWGYVICGITDLSGYNERDIWLIKTDSSGDALWTKTFCQSGDDQGFDIQQTSDQGYIITGNFNHNLALIKTTADLNPVKTIDLNIPANFDLTQNFPNPFNPATTFKYFLPKSAEVTISIYDICGRLIELKTEKLNPGSYNYNFNGSGYSTGLYIYRMLTSSGFSAERKMLLLK